MLANTSSEVIPIPLSIIVKVLASLLGTRRIYFSSPFASSGFDASSNEVYRLHQKHLILFHVKIFHDLNIVNEPLGPKFLLLQLETDEFFLTYYFQPPHFSNLYFLVRLIKYEADFIGVKGASLKKLVFCSPFNSPIWLS